MRRLLQTVGSAALVTACAVATSGAIAQGKDQITGPADPCQNAKVEYQYCRASEYPYLWSWQATGGVQLTALPSTSDCFRVEMTAPEKPVTLTFAQTVPSIKNVSRTIQPKRCTASTPATASGG